jgi:hypothetical protein
LQYSQTLSQSVPDLHVVSSSGMQHDLPFAGPSRQRPLSEEDEQVCSDDEPDVVPPPPPPDGRPLVLPVEGVPSSEDVPPVLPEVPPELVSPELEPLSSLEEHAATMTARRRDEESEAMRAMFMEGSSCSEKEQR